MRPTPAVPRPRLRRVAAALLLGLLAESTLAADEVYKSVDADGHVVYSDRGSSKSAPKVEVHVTQPDPAEVARLAREQASLKAQDERRSKQEASAAKAQAHDSQRREAACQKARNEYYRLKDTPRPYQRDADGNRLYYSDDEADALREQARRAFVSACGA
jgi:Domain of unknown function (DUF4124)